MRKLTARIILIMSFIMTGTVIFNLTPNITARGNSEITNRLTKVSVYYESLCPYSVSFITTQLYPNYNHLKEHIHIEWVPYGWTKQSFMNGKWVFRCQHGDDECKANRYQACALFQNKSQDQNMEFINCVLSLYDPAATPSVKYCASQHGFDWSAIETCFNSSEGSKILSQFGNRTQNLSPKLRLIPTVIFNDHFDAELDKVITTHFLKIACSQIPFPKPEKCR